MLGGSLSRPCTYLTQCSRGSRQGSGRWGVVGARGGREVGVLATARAQTMHLLAASAAPAVAVLLEAVSVTSSAKELHAAVAVLVEGGVKEPAVEVVAGCLEALIDLLHGLLDKGCGGSGGGGRVRVALRPPALIEQLAADAVPSDEAGFERGWHRVDADGDAGTEAAVEGGAAAAGAGGFPVHEDQLVS
jgi:hypothetical protein